MKIIIYYLVLIWIIFACDNPNANKTAAGNGQNQISEEDIAQYLGQWIDSTTVRKDLPQIDEDKFRDDINSFYHQRSYTPAWNSDATSELLDLIQNIDTEGLNPDSYPIQEIRQLQNPQNAEEAARLDLLLSATYLKIADVIASGKVKAGKIGKDWHIKPTTPDTLYTQMQKAAKGNVDESLDYFRPRFDQYDQLQKQLNRYHEIVENGGWPVTTVDRTLSPGDSSVALPDIRKRLSVTGDYQESGMIENPAIYDSSMISAVQNFQRRHGLEIQPEINENMVEAMNVPASTRLKQIMLNLDRIRWFSSGDMPETYVLVNIPEYRLRIIQNKEIIKTMKVVVGEVMHTTPIFSDVIEYAIFSPYWNVPESIAEEELWPAARKNPNYLENNHFEVLNSWDENASVVPYSEINWDNLDKYRIRQKPGPWNSLGRVKFMFPNDFAIYLHDTPADHLFAQSQRDFSHGCIRIEEPAWFANWLFDQYDLQDVQRKMTDEERDVVGLSENVPVYIFYATSFVDEQGRLNFREDLYELDKKLIEEFEAI